MADDRVVIAFDVAMARTGVAHGRCDGRPVSQVWTFNAKDEVHVRFGALGLAVAKLVEDLKHHYGVLPYLAVVEAEIRGGDKLARNPDTVFALIGGIATVMGTLVQCRVARIEKAPVTTIRKAFTGRGVVPGYVDPISKKKVDGGEAGKRLVREQCRVLGWTFQDHNAADALAAWSYGVGAVRSLFAAGHTPLFGRKEHVEQ